MRSVILNDDGNTVSSSALLHCPELLPLAIICHTERDHTMSAAALQLYASSANLSIKRWNLISKSQIPASIWTSVMTAIMTCLQAVSATMDVGKAAQYKILTVLSEVLESNPFQRNFTAECTERQSIEIVKAEIMELQIIDRKDLHDSYSMEKSETFNNSEAQAAIEFLAQELSFLKALQCVLPPVLKVLNQGRLRGLAARTVNRIEHVLQNPCFGLDPCDTLSYIDYLPEELSAMVLRVIQNRCLHEQAFLEIAYSTIENAKQESSITSGQHILKSIGYGHLQKLSSLLRKAYIDTGDMNESKIINFLITKLCAFPNLNNLFQSGGSLDETVTLGTAIIATSTQKKMDDILTVETILLCLSVLLVNYDGEVTQLKEPCQAILASLLGLKEMVMQKCRGCALYFSICLLLLTQAIPSASGQKHNIKNCTSFFSPHQIVTLTNLIFPDMLVDSCVMPVSIALAMRLKDPQRLLFESIGYLQDSTFCLEQSSTESIVHYANLITTVLTENSKMIQNSARENTSEDNNSPIPSSSVCKEQEDLLGSSSSLKNKNIRGGNSSVKGSHGNDNSNYSNEGGLTVYDDDGAATNYMRSADLEEQISKKMKDDLEYSVTSSDSFLACFVPLFKQLVTADHLPEAVRVCV